MDHKVSKDMISSGMTPSGEKTQADLARTQYGSAPSPSRLMDAYKSMYEHHQKDKDGNTIPHEDDIKEGKIPAGLQAFLDKKKGKKKDDGDEKKSKKGKGKPDFLDLDKDGDKKEPMKKASKEMKEGAGLYANIHAKRKRGGKMRKKGDKGAPSSQDFANAARTAKEDVDLFDVISGKFINEGYDEKDVYKAMSSLTEEQLQNIDEAIPLIGAALAGAGKFVTGLGAKTVLKKGAAFLAKQSAGREGLKNVAMAFKNPTAGNVTKAAGNVGQGALNLKTKADVARSTVSGGGGGDQPQNTINKTSIVRADPNRKPVAASADLFDIVKGQLLDEGLSEEEIRDIMLALTPDEIMSEMAVNPNIAAMDAKNKADMIARAQANKVPDKVKEASKRQMKAGTPREDPKNPYTTQDKKTIIDYNKNK